MWYRLVLAALLALDMGAVELSGRVVRDDSGAPVASAIVRIHEISDMGRIETDAEGRFRVSISAGRYRLEAERPGYLVSRVSLTIDGPRAVTVRLVRLGAVTGRVTDPAGQPARRARVLALEGGLPRATAPVDDTGRYRLYGLPPGQYTVAVSCRAQAPPPVPVTVAGGDEHRGVDFAILPGPLVAIGGRVELPAPGAAFAVALVPADRPAAALATARTSADGSFRFDGVPAGTYDLLACGPVLGRAATGWILGSDPLFGRARVEAAGADTAGIAIPLNGGRRAAIRLAAPRGACTPPAAVAMSPLEDWGAMLHRSIPAAFDRDTPVEGLAPGRYRLTAEGGDCFQTADAVLDAVAPNAAAAVPLSPAGSVRGRLTGPAPGECAVVLLGPTALHAAIPGPDGGFAILALPPGRYRVAVRRNPDARWLSPDGWTLDLDIPGGVPTEVELPSPARERVPWEGSR